MVGQQSNTSRWFRTAQAIILALAVLAPATVRAQDVKFKVEERSSLAWWQMSPHLLHLWATTCPGDPSWQPGAERSSGWVVDDSKYPSTGHSNTIDTIHVPLYPRPVAQAICTPAVRGEFTVRDTVRWTGVKGMVAIRVEHLITGLDMRDNYARKAVLQTSAYPEVKFQVDSMINQRKSGDTTIADLFGIFEMRGVRVPKKIRAYFWQEPLGLRVTAKFKFPGTDLPEVYKMSRLSLGLGVGTGLWKIVHLGIDAILTPGS
ncbi:MAG: hypothetical protein EXR93_11610 [Gemmatimonadetes bacterium]|nr:hypothetical protein [Gemmatimonadota bacterium]